VSVLDERGFQSALKRYQETTAREQKVLRPMRIESREPDGTLLVRRLDGECVERAAPGPGYQGELIEITPSPALNLSGAAGMSLARTGRLANTMALESLEPHVFAPGESYTCDGTGYGFLPSLWLDFIEPGSEDEINADVTVTAVRVLTDKTFELDLTIAPGAGLIDFEAIGAGVRFDNVGAPI